MGRFRAVAQVAAFFLVTSCLSPLAQAQAIDVTAAVERASSFVVDASTVAEYVAAYTAGEPTGEVEMPGFRRKYLWQFTYRSDAPDAMSAEPAQSERFPGMNTTLDDSWVVGLRFEMDYGWTR